jgi:uncharacterized protein DUF6922
VAVETASNGLPVTSQWLFPEYDFKQMDPEGHAGVVIERLLEQGSWAEVNWLFDSYGEQKLAEWLCLHGFRLLSPRSFALWRLILKVDHFVAPDWALRARALGW